MRGSELTIRHRLEAYATLARRVVAVGFVDRPTGDHLDITPSLHVAVRTEPHPTPAPLHHSIASPPPLHFYVPPNIFTHIPNRTRR
jgi:hypothetical protein